jgi:carbamate kinase
VRVVTATGKRAVIGSVEHIEDMLAGHAGTEVCLQAAGGADVS